MLTFNQRLRPAAEAHVNAQLAFLNDMTQSLLQSVQQIGELHLNLTQRFIEEASRLGHDCVVADQPAALVSAAAQAQPAGERLRAYHDGLARISAEAQAELSRCAGRHVPETSRTAKALADEFMRDGAEETRKEQQAMQGQLETMQTMQTIQKQQESRQAAAGEKKEKEEDTVEGSVDVRRTIRQSGAEAAARADGKKPGPQGRRP
jgi:uncharacterized phage infection (PIP) family protein YhgE